MKSRVSIFLLFFFAFFPVLLRAQERSLTLTLKIRDGKEATLTGGKAQYNGSVVPLSGVLVSVYNKATKELVQSQTTGADGNVTFKLEAFKEYNITTFKKDYVMEQVWVDASVKGKENKYSFKYQLDQIILLYGPESEKLKAELLDKPFAKVSYFGGADNNFDVDKAYENTIKAEAGRMSAQARADAYSRLKNGGRITEKPPIASGTTGGTTGADPEKAYKDLLYKADKLFMDKDYNKARDNYEQCLSLKPNENYPKEQLGKINRVYKDALYKADQLVLNKEYERAMDLYKEASGYNPKEQYPKDQIKEMNRMLHKSEVSGDYQSLISNGDKAFKD